MGGIVARPQVRVLDRRGSLYNLTMFLHDTGDPARTIAISQSSHAWLAWQLAEHWGNRRFSRPLPRAEVLAAVMLHDSGWTEFDPAPGIDALGRPRTFDNMALGNHLEIWRTSVLRTSMVSRYAAILVASHFAAMAEVKSVALLESGETSSARLVESFRAEMERLEASWSEALGTDARYQDVLQGPRRQANAAILTLADRVSVYLCGSLASKFEVRAPAAEVGMETVRLNALDRANWRVDPWPMEGDRVRMQVEGRLLPRRCFESADEFHAVLDRAPVERVSFTLMRASAIG